MSTGRITPANILVVDDEAPIRRLVATLMEAQGHSVRQAGDGAQALALLQAGDAPVDLLITDVRMQGMDGLRLARELAASHPKIRIIFMSGFIGEEEPSPEFPVRWDFIPKPFLLPELLSLVNRVLGGGLVGAGKG